MTHDHDPGDEDRTGRVDPHWPDERVAIRAADPDAHIPEDEPFCTCGRCSERYWEKARQRQIAYESQARRRTCHCP